MKLAILSAIISFLIMVWINYLPHKYPQKVILHIHHWITGLFLILFAFLVKRSSPQIFNIIIGGLIGLVLEDLLFHDEFKIKVKC
jgi:hypothetical protein